MRGDLVTIVMQGDFGKPRPASVTQADLFKALGRVLDYAATSNG